MASSYLFSLPLRGVGSVEVESLPSYLCRLSAAHSASVRDVIEHAFLWLRRSGQEVEMPFVTRSPERLGYYVRPNSTTRLLVEALAAATQRRELRCGTFLALEQALDRCMGTFDGSLRWCPMCVREFAASSDEGYFKLQWQLADVMRCVIHGVPLANTCPHCGVHQNGSARRTDCVHCVRCEQPLCQSSDVASAPGSWRVEAADLIAVVDEISSDAELAYPADGCRRLLSELFDRVWGQEQELKLWKIVPRDECLAIIDGTLPVTLKTARRLAYRLGIRLPDLMAGVLAPTTSLLDASWTDKLPSSMRPRRRAARRDREFLMGRLEDALHCARKGQPVSLRHVAIDLGVSTGCLSYHFPLLARELLSLHRRWREEERRRKSLEARSVVLKYIAERAMDGSVSRKGMLRTLRAETGLPKEVLRTEIGYHFLGGQSADKAPITRGLQC